MWRRLGAPPTHEELEKLWADDKKFLALE